MLTNRQIADQLRWLRRECGVTQGWLAAQIGLARSGYARVELGQRALRFREAVAIAGALRLPLVKLLPDAPKLQLHGED